MGSVSVGSKREASAQQREPLLTRLTPRSPEFFSLHIVAPATFPTKDASGVQNNGTYRRDLGVAHIPLPQNTLLMSTSEAIESHRRCGEGSRGPARTTDSAEGGFGKVVG